jgi:hypothetical protein
MLLFVMSELLSCTSHMLCGERVAGCFSLLEGCGADRTVRPAKVSTVTYLTDAGA